jgi:hypothetical protein
MTKEFKCLDAHEQLIGVVYGRNIDEAKLSLMYCELPPSDFGVSHVVYLVEPSGRRYKVK